MKKLISWVEIPTENIERAVNFYNSVFDLNLEIMDCGSEKMACFPNGEGAISQAPDFKPSKDGVLVSLNTGDHLQKTIDKIVEKDGKIIKEKTKIEAEGYGYFALFIDCEGNKIGLYGDK